MFVVRVICILICAFFGCALTACYGRPGTYSTPGTLYAEFWAKASPPIDTPTETTLIRNGRIVGTRPVAFAVARDRPDRSFNATNTAACDRYSYQVSPDGLKALCFAPSGEQLRLFNVTAPNQGVVVLSDFENNANETSFAWLSNDRFAAMSLDRSCPYAQLYDFFPTRVTIFDRKGHRLSAGRCAFGIVAGNGRVALLGELPNSALWHFQQFFASDMRYDNDGYNIVHHAWSVDDGKTWHDGAPLTFDGNNQLLYSEAFGDDVYSESGLLVLRNVSRLEWSR